ncbi:MAG TPA: PAS domain S-box protein, partial [Telluria sp.]|nr:PAS domain S-box protein [Telluria sp.]
MTSHVPAPASALSDSDRLRLFVSGVTDYALYMLSPEGLVASWNAGAQRFKAYTADEIIGQHFSRFYTEEDRARGKPAKALQTALAEGKFEDEGWRVRKDGSRFWASVVIDPIRDSEGVLLGFAKITRDITERKQAQEALNASEEQFRRLVQGVTDYAIYMLSPDGIITNWNAGAERIKGFTESEVVGTHFERFYAEEDRAKGVPGRALQTARATGRYENEGVRVRKDGTTFWSHVVIDAIHNDMGDLIGFAKITRDVTERRNAALALERTKEALFQSQKLEAIGKLTGGVAHDFNNLLGVIVSGTELLSREVASPGGKKVIQSMQRASQRGAALTQQLLSFARQQPLQQDRLNLSTLVARFDAILRRACGPMVQFELTLGAALPPVLIDATQFEAALLNLVANARDAMPGGGTLGIRTGTATLREHQLAGLAAGDYVVVTVTDNGEGMPADVVARAVEPFFTTKERGKGTGMGLSQVYGLIQQSGGGMTIDSAVGKGTTIAVYLPALAGEADMPNVRSGNERVLVVDDEPDVLDVAIELFKNMGYDVLSANNGKDAIDILKRNPDIDVLFSDVVMPGLNGIELGQAARALMPTMKIVLASGYPQ